MFEINNLKERLLIFSEKLQAKDDEICRLKEEAKYKRYSKLIDEYNSEHQQYIKFKNKYNTTKKNLFRYDLINYFN